MLRRGDVSSESVIQVIMIIASIIIAIWLIRGNDDYTPIKKVNTNLNVLQDAVDFACLFDYIELDAIYVLRVPANLTIRDTSVCIDSIETFEICRTVMCGSSEKTNISLDSFEKIGLIRDEDGFIIKKIAS